MDSSMYSALEDILDSTGAIDAAENWIDRRMADMDIIYWKPVFEYADLYGYLRLGLYKIGKAINSEADRFIVREDREAERSVLFEVRLLK